MKTRNMFVIAAAMGISALAFAGNAQATGLNEESQAVASMTVDNFTELQATNNFPYIKPDFTDIRIGSIEQSGAFTLSIATNSSTGCRITVSAEAGNYTTNKIAAGDIQLRSSDEGTAPAFQEYKALATGPGVTLWSTDAPQLNADSFDIDMKINNLGQYLAKSGVSTDYENTLTFVAVANSN